MLSIALKNAILVILIILILHFLIKNYLLMRQEGNQVVHEPFEEVATTTTEAKSTSSSKTTSQEDEEVLYNFIKKNKALNAQIPTSVPSNIVSAQPIPGTAYDYQPMSFGGNFAPI